MKKTDEEEGTDMTENEEPTSAEDKKPDVQVFHRVNKLKKKAGGEGDGPGYIDKDAIKRAQTVIVQKHEAYTQEVEVVISSIESSWNEALEEHMRGEEASLESLYHYANHIKDLASTFGYELMQHFGSSLRDFIETVDLTNKAHHIIVKAHIDVMWVAYKENIRDHGGEKAEELKMFVAKAIEKYS